MIKPLQYMGQGLFYALFFGVIGYFSTWPTYTYLQPDETLIKLSFGHAGQLKEACRERTPEELAKLPMYQRKVTTICPSRERADVVVELEMDGKQLYHVVLPPTGFAHSGTSNIYRRIPVKAGVHTLKARLKDHIGEEFNFMHEETVHLVPGRIMVIDFKSATGGFIFKNKNTTQG
ncbi:MAG: hypothetical protein HYS19_02980 [Nitrosomonadales bacterium]|nr:hypothetical protein [Nitrosomonadales bacterium]